MTTRILKAAALATLTLAALASCGGDDQGEWGRLTPMPTPRTGVGVIDIDELIYVAGGIESDGSVSTKVEVYDPANDSWSEIRPLPEARHHSGAARWGGDLLVIGGFATESEEEQTATVFRYSAETGAWTENPPLQTARGAFGATHYAGNPVAIGGAGMGELGRVVSLNSAEWMDAKSEEWHDFSAPIQIARDHLAAATVTSAFGDVLEDELHVVGGRYDLDAKQAADLHDSSLNLAYSGWESRRPLSAGRGSVTAATISSDFGTYGSQIYLFGGTRSEGALDTVEVYDVDSDKWNSLAKMPTPREGHGAAEVGGAIYVIGGSTSPHAVTGANEAFTP